MPVQARISTTQMRRVVLHFQPGDFDVYGGLLRLLPTGCLDRPGCRISQASVSDVYQQLAWRDEVARRRGNTEYGVRSTEYGARCSQFICHLGTKLDSEVTPVSPGRRTAFSPTSFFCNKGGKKRIVQSALQHRHMVKPFIFASEANIELKLVGGSCWPPHSPTSWSRHNEASKVAMHPRRFVQCTLPCKAATRTVSKT